jgi:hypothetical protein
MRNVGVIVMLAMCMGVASKARQPIKVTIDVKPGDQPTSLEVNRAGGMVPIAVLSTAAFDASTIDPASITAGPTGTEATPVRSMFEDIDKDGRTDLISHVRLGDLGLKCGDTAILLKATTKTGAAVEGAEKIVLEGC